MFKSIKKVTIYAVIISIGIFIFINEPETKMILRSSSETENEMYADNESGSETSYDMSYYNNSDYSELTSGIESNNTATAEKVVTSSASEKSSNNNEVATNNTGSNYTASSAASSNSNVEGQQSSGPNIGDLLQDFAVNNTPAESEAKNAGSINTGGGGGTASQSGVISNESNDFAAFGGVGSSFAPPPPGGGYDPNEDVPLDDFYGILVLFVVSIIFIIYSKKSKKDKYQYNETTGKNFDYEAL